MAPFWSVTFTLVLTFLPTKRPLLTLPDTVAMSEPPDVVTTVVGDAVEVFFVFHVIVTLVTVLPAFANVAQFCFVVPLAEPTELPPVTPPPLQPLTGSLKLVV